MAKRKRIGVDVFLSQAQSTLDSWTQKLSVMLDSKKKEQAERQKNEAKKQELVSLICQLNGAGASVREIAETLGKENISHATIARYIKLARKETPRFNEAKEQPQNATT